MISGCIYLNGYLSEYGIPFPLDIGVLASLLLVIGSLSVIFVAVILLYFLLVSLVSFDPFESNYHKVINLSKEGDYIPRIRNYVCFVFLFYLLPLISAMLLVIMKHKNFINAVTACLLYLLCTIPFLVYAFFFSKKVSKQKSKFFVNMVAYFIVCQFASFLSFAFFILLMAKQYSEISDLESIGVILAFVAINFFCLIPMISNGKYNIKKDDVYTEDYLIESPDFTHRFWFIILLT